VIDRGTTPTQALTGGRRPPDDGVPGPFERELERLRHEAAVDEAAARRARRNDRLNRLSHDSSLRSVLGDTADRQTDVTLLGNEGQRLVGRVTTIGRDFVGVLSTRRWVVRLDAIAAVVDPPGSTASIGQQSEAARLDRSFSEVLHHVIDHTVVVLGARNVLASGVLRGSGHDYLRVENTAERRSTYVNYRAVWALEVEAELWGSAS